MQFSGDLNPILGVFHGDTPNYPWLARKSVISLWEFMVMPLCKFQQAPVTHEGPLPECSLILER